MFNKKGISIMIGYILLVTISLVISTFVYQQLKTYVPGEGIECTDGVSIFLKEVNYDCTAKTLNLILKNNGRFGIAGYFIKGTDAQGDEIATIDLSDYTSRGVGGVVILDLENENSLSPGNEVASFFDLSSSSVSKFYSLEITPIRYEEIKNKKRIASCGNAKIKEKINCGEEFFECIPDTCSGLGYICGDSWDDGCGVTLNCGICVSGAEFCDASGQCISNDCTPAADPSQSGICGIQTCGLATNGTCGDISCSETDDGTCSSGFTCNATNQCEQLCGNGVIDTGETCDSGLNCEINCACPSGYIADGSLGCTTIGNGLCDAGETCSQEPLACEGQQAQCAIGQTCQSGSCVLEGGVYGEDEYCIDLGLGYVRGDCVANSGQCNSQGGFNEDDEPGADEYCPGQLLCCFE